MLPFPANRKNHQNDIGKMNEGLDSNNCGQRLSSLIKNFRLDALKYVENQHFPLPAFNN